MFLHVFTPSVMFQSKPSSLLLPDGWNTSVYQVCITKSTLTTFRITCFLFDTSDSKHFVQFKVSYTPLCFFYTNCTLTRHHGAASDCRQSWLSSVCWWFDLFPFISYRIVTSWLVLWLFQSLSNLLSKEQFTVDLICADSQQGGELQNLKAT